MNRKQRAKIKKEKDRDARNERNFNKLFDRWKQQGLSESELHKKLVGFKYNN